MSDPIHKILATNPLSFVRNYDSNLVMKRSLTALVVVLSTITATYPAFANEVNASPDETAPGKAATLVTQPASINSEADHSINQAERLKQITNSIPSVHDQPTVSLNPFDILKHPSTTLKQFLQEKPNPKPQPVDPLGVSKVPPLDSFVRGSISVPVTHF
jgi:hypothetical protein